MNRFFCEESNKATYDMYSCEKMHKTCTTHYFFLFINNL